MKIKNYRIISRIIIIVVLLGLVITAGFYALQLTSKQETIKVEYLEGQIIAIKDRTVSLRDDNNRVYSIDLSDVEIGDDQFQFGSQISLQYTGILESEVPIDIVKASVQVPQIINGTIESDKLNKIIGEVSKMSLEQKVAQMFFVVCPDSGAVSLLDRYQVGGYFLENKDFKNKSRNTVIANIKAYQAAVKIPLLIMVNEEGGKETSVSNNLRSNRFRLAQNIFKSGGMDSIIADTTEKTEFLQAFGINVNMNPVADLPDSSEDFIYERSFGTDVDETSNYVKSVVKVMKGLKMGSVLKHFPGYGNAPDTNNLIYHDTRDYDVIMDEDIKPFKAGVEAGANCILVGHNIVDVIDNQNPGSLSSNMISLVRKELEYNGVIMSDNISKATSAAFGSAEEVAIKSVQAGNDMIITDNPQEHIEAIINAAKSNQIDLNDLDKSVMRILAWKSQLDLY